MKDQQDNAVIRLGFVEELLVGVILGTGDEEIGWARTARKLAENVEPRPGVSQIYFKSGLIINEPLLLLCKMIKTQQSNHFLLKDQDNVEIEWGVVEHFVDIVIIRGTDSGWTETARKLAESVEPGTGKIPSRWGRYMIWKFFITYTLFRKKEVFAQQKCPSKRFKFCYVYVKRKSM